MDPALLERIGLNANEAKIYLSLLNLGHAQAGEISKRALINRTSTYDALGRLIANGLVAFSLEANRRVFRPVSPAKFLELLKEQEDAVQGMLPELNRLFLSSKEKQESNIYIGKKGIKAILQDILNYPEYVAYGSGGFFLDVMGHDFVSFQKRKEERKIKSRVVVNESSKKTQGVRGAFANFRFVRDEYSSGPVTTFIYGDNVAIVVWVETPLATVISNSEVAKNFKSHFELLWKTSKR